MVGSNRYRLGNSQGALLYNLCFGEWTMILRIRHALHQRKDLVTIS